MLYIPCNSCFKKIAFSALIFLISAVFAQEGIKFQVPLDEKGELIIEALPQKLDTVQKLGVTGNRPLNLALLSAKDTASFETYSNRIALLQDSISAMYKAIEIVKKNTASYMPVLEPRGEFEKQMEYDARQAAWDKEYFDRTERDTRSLALRLDELEKAKKKVEGHQTSMYSSVSIKSSPAAASVWVGKEEIGITPVDYNYLIPGPVTISFAKKGYNRWDTTLQAIPGAKFKINVELDEKSIFSERDEINFVRFLSNDATVEVYEQRIRTIETRKIQVDGEMRTILETFANSYPALEPQRIGESPSDFNKRREVWSQEGLRQAGLLKEKHEIYKNKLDRSIAVLNDYILAAQSVVMSEPSPSAKVELGAYDADKEQFELVAQNAVGASPFYFSGRIGVPRDTAKSIDRASPNFAVNLQYISYPFRMNSQDVNLAMSKLQLSRNGLNYRIDGSFGELEPYKSAANYEKWKLRADSILSGKLKPQGLDYAYAMNKQAAKKASESDNVGISWRSWTRIFVFAAAASLGAGAVVKHIEAGKSLDDIDKLKGSPPLGNAGQGDVEKWKNEYNSSKRSVERNELQRNAFGVVSVGCILIGALTIVF
ncbi:MAG: PEGA domain-containing protein [Fibromonadales bacterium]|nr:PEGA domain-containing protein [Fibromonadales bacterium]